MESEDIDPDVHERWYVPIRVSVNRVPQSLPRRTTRIRWKRVETVETSPTKINLNPSIRVVRGTLKVFPSLLKVLRKKGDWVGRSRDMSYPPSLLPFSDYNIEFQQLTDLRIFTQSLLRPHPDSCTSHIHGHTNPHIPPSPPSSYLVSRPVNVFIFL